MGLVGVAGVCGELGEPAAAGGGEPDESLQAGDSGEERRAVADGLDEATTELARRHTELVGNPVERADRLS